MAEEGSNRGLIMSIFTPSVRRGQPTRKMDPLERSVPLAIKSAVYALLIVYLVQAAGAFYEYVPGERWPFLLTIIRNGIFLFIHEGGHGLFMFFGETLHVLGGSFWQIVFPLLSFLIALRKRSHFIAPFALFWVGTNMMDVSLYMRDAPVRLLPLLGGHKSWHDWWNLFRSWDLLDSAGTFADVFFFIGITLSIVAIGGGVYLAVERYLHPIPYKIPADESESRVSPSIVKPNRAFQQPVLEKKPVSPREEKNTFEGL